MKYKLITAVLCFICLTVVNGQDFQKFLTEIDQLPAGEKQVFAEKFIKSCPGIPFRVHDTMAHFIYQGNAKTVQLAGDVTGWKPGFQFTRLEGTDFWYYSASYAPDARMDYKYVIDGKRWILDTMNPDSSQSGFGFNSELRMQGNRIPPEVLYYDNIPHGIIKDTVIKSTILGNSRKIKIYLPPGYPMIKEGYPVALFHDGIEFLEICKVNQILDYLISKRQIKPLIAVFVPPVDRDDEYSGQKKDLFTGFIVDELMKMIDLQYKTSKKSSDRANFGISNGGNIALYIGVKHPEVFGKISAQSSNVIPGILQTINNVDNKALEFYLDIGKYDIDVLIPLVNNFHRILVSGGFKCSFMEWNEGHSWSAWKEHLRYPLSQFFHL